MNLLHARQADRDPLLNADSRRIYKGAWRQGAALMTLLLGVGLLAGQARAGDILETIDHDPAYSTFSSLLRKAGIAGDLKAGAGFTVFAPSNAAFAELSDAQRHQLFDTDSAAARRALENLVVAKKYLPQDIAHNRVRLTSVSGRSVLVDGTEGRLMADDTEILSVDTSPSNGVIYAIDGVNLSQQSSERDSD
ncbi:MAG TPA: fasciclin domain-containing protein [Dongiaceae bacterium]